MQWDLKTLAEATVIYGVHFWTSQHEAYVYIWLIAMYNNSTINGTSAPEDRSRVLYFVEKRTDHNLVLLTKLVLIPVASPP